jgi:hypothetical protein
MNESYFLTLTLLFLAHCIGDWTPLRPFDKQIIDAKRNGIKRNRYFLLHSLTMVSYKIIAIIVSNFIIPIQLTDNWVWYVRFGMILILFAVVELISHFIFDTTKDFFNFKFKLTLYNRHYWTLIGFDQFLHAVIMFWVCYYLYYS